MARSRKKAAPKAEAPKAEQEAPNERRGDATLAVMAMAGVTARQEWQRWWALALGVVGLGLATAVGLDVAGVWDMPLIDIGPSVEAERSPNAGSVKELSMGERERLRRKLLGLEQGPPAEVPRGRMSAAERAVLLDIYGSERKKEQRVGLPDPQAVVAPNLPAGLTPEAIYKVIADNSEGAPGGDKIPYDLDEAGPGGDATPDAPIAAAGHM